ncbi:phosphotriesterase [Actinomadura sp. HBU206391]|uniref:phosphotriesterase family protein n=1 Tax=Actinomadura sp. HBU206391 TaxID=2731692 RepID=UPI0016502EBE|nr:aryldialkylphosphatase [Actinomadura sp. HBU206391]MBC6463210.1 aryldialkylphosphatase [Actinomadura sp. HBU206391]
MTGRVRTVLGDIEPETLGRTDYHEHLFQVTPLLPGDELDDEGPSGEEARLLRAAGIDAMVEATPTGLGRDPAATARISARTGLGIVLTTGAHREAHYPSGHWLTGLDPSALAGRFVADLLDGAPATDGPGESAPARSPRGEPVRAGLLKAGIGYWSINRFERGVLDAVATAHRTTGAPVMVHLEHGSAAAEVLEILASGGVPADRVVLAHIDRNPDPGLHAELAATGAYLGYDGMARTREWPDSALLDCLLRVSALGGAGRLLLGGDVARRTRYVAYGGMPGLAYLPTRFIPRLEREGGADLVRAVLVDNPARLLAWSRR